MVNPSLPEEILIEIFSRLPSKPVGKCKCLSKSWRTQLSDPQFINLHFKRKPYQENLIIISGDCSLSTVPVPIIDDYVVSRKLDLRNSCNSVAGSCNGLVLLANADVDELCLVNPTTLEQVRTPTSTLKYPTYGFGYDMSTDDYKIIKLSWYAFKEYNTYDDSSLFESFAEVYSLKKDIWKRVEGSTSYYHPVSSGAFVNGAIHWLASREEMNARPVIVAFDVATEVFHEIPEPIGFERKNLYHGLFIVGGCLSMVCTRDGIDVWIMKEYGLADSWMNLRVYYPDNCLHNCRPIYFNGEKEAVFVSYLYCRLVLCNLEDGTSILNMLPLYLSDGGTFVDRKEVAKPETKVNRVFYWH